MNIWKYVTASMVENAGLFLCSIAIFGITELYRTLQVPAAFWAGRGYHGSMERSWKESIISQSDLTALNHGGNVTLDTIDRLCKALDCQPGDLLEYVPDEEPEETEWFFSVIDIPTNSWITK